MEKKTIKNWIYNWVADNYGTSEADDPSWDIDGLALMLYRHRYEIHDKINYEEVRDYVDYIAHELRYDLTDEQIDEATHEYMLSEACQEMRTEDIEYWLNHVSK